MSVSAVHGGSQAEKQAGLAPQPVAPPSGVTSFAQELDAQKSGASHHHHHGGASQSVTSSAAAAASAAGAAPVSSVGSALLHLIS
jgi:hypothetical protein